jgi:type III pantothenate kinase
MQALIDIGNTQIKWAALEGGELTRRGHAWHRGTLDAALRAFADALPSRVDRFVVANVAGQEVAERLNDLARQRSDLEPRFVTTARLQFGVRCAYADPARLGVDRWVAVLAAYRAAHGAACVLDAGTAVTFDAVAADGRHLGGLIFPGAHLAAAALQRRTSDIGPTLAAGRAPVGLDLLGRSTDVAVAHGAMLELAAALDRAVAIVERALGAKPAVYLTGGDAEALSAWLETKAELRADLVLEGLALFAREG